MNILPRQFDTENKIKVAYFSMEIFLENDVATYAGGLGMLAGDILRSLADKEIPAIGVTMAFNNGYTNQVINKDGTQQFVPAEWIKSDQLIKLSDTITLKIEGRDLKVSAYRYDIVGPSGFIVPVILLTSDYFENSDDQRYFSKYLYDHDKKVRMIQEVILGIGGVKMLRQLGFKDIENFHMNDGHCAFLTLEVLREQAYDMERTKQQCCFTTHTPVPAGRDQFDYEMVYNVISDYLPMNIKALAGENSLDMPELATNLSKYTNGVSRKHGEVSSNMFKKEIDYITNGIHPQTWTPPVTQEVFDLYIPDWRKDINELKNNQKIPDNMLLEMHRINKRILIDFINRYHENKGDNGSRFDYDTLTITFARRCVTYKRPDLIFYDLKRLLRLGVGKIQLVFTGKTHPDDKEAHEVLRKIIEYRNKFSQVMSIAFIENYQPSYAKLLEAGSDVWLNNPVIPLEASGTSGMKAAMNGTINFSILDGWFPEGMEIEPDAGFIIGEPPTELFPPRDDKKDSDALYKTLEEQIIPTFYDHKDQWLKKMRASIRLSATYSTSRVVDDYMQKAWK